MPPPLCMASAPWPGLVLAFLVLNMGVVTGAQTGTMEDEGGLLDVRTFSLECMENDSCEVEKPSHLIEYFSADWCEPCVQVGEQLRNLNDEGAVVLQHHSSPQDATFLAASKLKYDHEFRLLFFPSIVVNGDHLLTGSRQALDLNTVMENTTPAWSGLDSLHLENNTLVWNASVEGTVSVWMLAPTPHQTSGTVHPTVAYNRVVAEAGNGTLVLNGSEIRNNTTFVVLLEQTGRRNLTVASLAPTGPVEVSDAQEANTTPPSAIAASTLAMLVGTMLVLSLLPALVMHRQLSKRTEGHWTKVNDGDE